MSIKLTILGFNSALPRVDAHPTAQLLEVSNQLFLIDCGEGTQVQIRKSKAKFSKLDHIFISHMHGDHVFGLAGLISSFNLLGRKKELHIYGPEGIKEFIEVQLKWTGIQKVYPLIFHELNPDNHELIYENDKLTVHSLPLSHRIPTGGFLFKEKIGLRKIDKQKIKQFPFLDSSDYRSLVMGKDVKDEFGEIISHTTLTLDPTPPRSYAYCSDTRYRPKLIPLIEKVDLLYHESTFLDMHKDLAEITGHSTAKQAAEIAKEAKVNALILGHFSNRYRQYEPFLEEAKMIFPNTFLPDNLKEFILE